MLQPQEEQPRVVQPMISRCQARPGRLAAMHGRTLALACTCALAASAPRAFAGADAVPGAGDLGTVTVIARVPRPLAEAAATVGVFDADSLARLGTRDVSDLARYEPALAVRRDATRFGAGELEIRGIGGNRVLIEVDGVPAAPRFAVGNFADAGRGFLDLDLVQRVEVLRGPASSLYGSDALGGVLALRSWDPADLLDADGVAARARAGWRSDDDGALATAMGAWRSGRLQALAAYAHRDAFELDNGAAVVAPNPARRRSRAWLAKLVAGERAPLRLTLHRQDSDTGTDVRSLLMQPGRFANTIAMLAEDAAETTLVAIDQRFAAAGPFAQAEWRAYWRRSAAAQDTFERRRATSPRTPPLALFRAFRFADETFGAEATGSVELGPEGTTRHRLVAGVEAERSRIAETRDGIQTDLLSGRQTTTILGEAYPVRDFPITTTLRLGAFAQAHVAFGTRGALIPAVRIDRQRLDPHVDAIYAADNARTVPVAVATASVSPRFAATWRIAGGATLYAQYTHGFRAPPFEDVNIGLDLPLFNTRAIPNPDLKPERSDGFEFGVRADAGALRGSASAYWNRYTDFIESKVNLGPDAAGTTIFQSRNVARARIWGAEASGTWYPGRDDGAAGGWFLRCALAYARGDDTRRGRPLNSVAPAKGVVGGGFDAPGGRWGTSVLATIAAAKSRVDESSAPLFRTPGYATLDLDGWWRPAPALELRAALLNATDHSYFEWIDVRGRAPTEPSLELFQRPGRSVFASVTWSLR